MRPSWVGSFRFRLMTAFLSRLSNFYRGPSLLRPLASPFFGWSPILTVAMKGSADLETFFFIVAFRFLSSLLFSRFFFPFMIGISSISCPDHLLMLLVEFVRVKFPPFFFFDSIDRSLLFCALGLVVLVKSRAAASEASFPKGGDVFVSSALLHFRRFLHFFFCR